MVLLNILASIKFERGATDGYAYSYLQPDGRTFGISWSIIYNTWLLILVFHADAIHSDARKHLQYAFILNGLWLIANGLAVKNNLSYWLAVVILFAYLTQLATTYHYSSIDYCSQNTSIVIHGAISVNLAWVILATFLNFSNTVFNDKLDLSKRENICSVGGPDWTIGILGLGGLLCTYVAIDRCDFILPLLNAHAMFGIVRNQTEGGIGNFPHKTSETLRNFAQTGGGVNGTCWFICFGKN